MSRLMKLLKDLLKGRTSMLWRNGLRKDICQFGGQEDGRYLYAVGDEMDGARIVSRNLQIEVVGPDKVAAVAQIYGVVRPSGTLIAHILPSLLVEGMKAKARSGVES